MKILGLACLAAVNPKLLGVDLILMGNRRPRLMWATRRFEDWLVGHARQLLTVVALLVGGYMVLSGTLRLLG